MLHRTCERPSKRTAREGAKTLATKRKRISIRVAKSLAGTVLAMRKNARTKSRSYKRSCKRG